MRMTTTTWPAPPIASAWDAYRVPLGVPASMCRRIDAPAPVAHKPAAPPRKSAARVPDFGISGVALVFTRSFKPTFHSSKIPADTVCVIKPGALDRSIRQINAGGSTCKLLIGHDDGGPVICSTDNSLFVYVDGDQLRFRVNTKSRSGRLALCLAQSLPHHREASVGLIDMDSFLYRGGDVPVLIVLRAELPEISIVPAGACNGTYVLVS